MTTCGRFRHFFWHLGTLMLLLITKGCRKLIISKIITDLFHAHDKCLLLVRDRRNLQRTKHWHFPQYRDLCFDWFEPFLEVLKEKKIPNKNCSASTRTSIDMDGTLKLSITRQPKSEICQKMPMFEQLKNQVLVNSKKNLTPWCELFKIIKGHETKIPTPSSPRVLLV